MTGEPVTGAGWIHAVDAARRWIPRRLRYFIQRYVSLTDLKMRYRELATPYSGIAESDENTFESPYRFGILRVAAQYHCNYVAACLEMGVPFRVLDLAGPDWIEQVRGSGCDVFVVWPDGPFSTWNSMVKDRVEAIERDLELPVFPSLNEIWMYEDKRRMTYWLEAHDVPHPRTWIFYDAGSCEHFVSSCTLPIVYKANFGAAASGVRVFKDRGRLRRFVRRVFRSGFVPDGFDRRDRQWGSVVLQEYLPEIKEWRLVRIGDSFFGHVKGQKDGIHSGSGVVEWDVPEARHLDFLEEVTEKGGFRSMDVDVFETSDGRLLVNELQALFGASHSVDQLRVNGVAGRFVKNRSVSGWVFEAGDFARNMCANERIRWLIGSAMGA